MELKKEMIGKVIKMRDKQPILIENDPNKFALYKNLGLDVFEAPKKKKKVNDSVNKSDSDK